MQVKMEKQEIKWKQMKDKNKKLTLIKEEVKKCNKDLMK